MRVAHVITRLILGGAQENTVLCCKELIHEYGDDVLLVTGPPLGPEGSLLEQARQFEIPLAIVDRLRRAIHPIRDLSAYRRVKHALREFRPDVVHTHSAKGGILGRYAASALNVPAIVHTVHGAPFHPYQSVLSRQLFRFCERAAARRCHHLISVADAMTELMVKGGVAPVEKFTTIYSGMEVDSFLGANDHRQRMRKELGYHENHIVVGKIARLYSLKGHADLLTAAGRLVQDRPDLRFLLVGDGVLGDHIRQDISRMKLDDFFQFTGLVPPEGVAELIGAMDMLVHTSLREGLARTLPQALIAGRPVISYDIDGAREVVINGKTGCLVQPGDVQGLERAIDALAGNPKRRAQYGMEGQRRFTDVFRHQHMTKTVRALYQDLLGRDNPTSNN